MDSPLFRIPVAFLLTALVVLLVRAPVDAASVVTNCTNDTDFSNQLTGGGTVTFNCGTATVALGSTKTIAANTTIDGGGTITLSGNTVRRLFVVNNGVSLTLKNIVLKDASATDNVDGGAVRNLGSLTVSSSTFTNDRNTPGFSGGAIYSSGTLHVSASVFDDNQAGSAGAIWEQGGTATIDNTSFNLDKATNTSPYGFGGAVLLTDNATGTITSSTFNQNTARQGGALHIRSGAHLTISDSTLTGNSSTSEGGGIYSVGTLTQTNVTLSGNSATVGGAIDTDGTMTITNGTVSNNSANFGGGGIFNDHHAATTLTNVTISSNTVSNNFSSVYGGGIENYGGLALTNSTLSGNSALSASNFGFGGGLYNNYYPDNVTLTTITNSTITGNSAQTAGGGILNVTTVAITNSTINANSAGNGGGIENYQGTATLTNVTISGNLASVSGGGIYQYAGSANQTISLTNTLVANGASGANCEVGVSSAAPITSNGFNLSSDGTCSPYFTQPSDLNGGNPNLGPLANNGGPTLTRMPQPLSDAIDSIPMGTNGCGTTLTTDQRGYPRPLGPACDIGSVEYGVIATATPSPTPTVAPTATATHTSTPTPTHSSGPTPTSHAYLQGDLNCDHQINALDALIAFAFKAGFPHPGSNSCPDVGATFGGHPFGDVTCDDNVDQMDGLAILQHVGGATIKPPQPGGCTALGQALS
jgi:predicted outer membrane repeat protein